MNTRYVTLWIWMTTNLWYDRFLAKGLKCKCRPIISIRRSFHHLSTYILRVSCLPPPSPSAAHPSQPLPPVHIFPTPNKDGKEEGGICIYYKRIGTIFRWDMERKKDGIKGRSYARFFYTKQRRAGRIYIYVYINLLSFSRLPPNTPMSPSVCNFLRSYVPLL